MDLDTRDADTAFAELICADAQWLREEFDALIAASFSQPPAAPPPAPPRVPPPCGRTGPRAVTGCGPVPRPSPSRSPRRGSASAHLRHRRPPPAARPPPADRQSPEHSQSRAHARPSGKGDEQDTKCSERYWPWLGSSRWSSATATSGTSRGLCARSVSARARRAIVQLAIAGSRAVPAVASHARLRRHSRSAVRPATPGPERRLG